MAKEEFQQCARCKRELPLSAFARWRNGHQTWCRACKKDYDAAWYQSNKAKRRAKVQADRLAHAAWLDTLKEGKPCADCGRVYPSYVMEWDHLPGTQKALVMANTRRCAYSKKRILAEIEKCELVCANCHRQRTFGRMARKAG